jgi:HEAT repeat protein
MDEEIVLLIRILQDNSNSNSEKTEASDKLCKMDKSKTIPLLIENLAFQNPEWIAWTISRIGVNDEQFNTLLENIKNNMGVSGSALALAELRDNRAVPTLINALNSLDSYSSSKANLILALGRTGDEEAVPILLDALKDKNEFVRAYACEGLGNINEPKFVPLLMDMLDDNHHVKIHATWALGVMGDSRAIPKLSMLIQSDISDEREEAANSIEKIGFQYVSEEEKIRCLILLGRADELAQEGAEFLHLITEELKSYSQKFRENAAQALEKIGFEKIGEEDMIRCLFIQKKDDELAGMKERAVPILLEALNDPSGEVKQLALELIGKIGLPALPLVLEKLEKMKVEDFEWGYVVKAFNEIAKQNKGNESLLAAIPLLLQRRPEPPQKMHVLQNSLYTWTNPMIYAQTEEYFQFTQEVDLKDKDVVEALTSIGKKAVPIIVKSIEEDQKRRDQKKTEKEAKFQWLIGGCDLKRALLAVSELGEKNTIPCLLEALRKGYNVERIIAAQAISKQDMSRLDQYDKILCYCFCNQEEKILEMGASAIPHLYGILKEDNLNLKKNAAWLLAQIEIKTKKYEEIEHTLRFGKNLDERVAAARALGKIRNEHSIPFLIKSLTFVDKEKKDETHEQQKKGFDTDHFWKFYGQQKKRVDTDLFWKVKFFDDSGLRRASADALAEIGVPAFDALVEVADNENKDVRSLVADSVGKIALKNPTSELISRAASVLIELSADASSEVARNADQGINLFLYVCDDAEKLRCFEEGLCKGYSKTRKNLGTKETNIRIAKLRMSISNKRNELSKDQGIILDDKPKPPKRNRMYQQMRMVVRN